MTTDVLELDVFVLVDCSVQGQPEINVLTPCTLTIRGPQYNIF